MEINIYTAIFIIAVIFNFIIEYYLILRNKQNILKNYNEVPKEFSNTIKLQEHQKAGDYTIAKQKFGIITTIYSIFILFFLTLGGGFDYIFKVITNIGLEAINRDISFLLTSFIIMSILSFPFSIYNTFVLEAKFGFNKTTARIFLIDTIKQLTLLLVLGYILLWLLLNVIYFLKDQQWWFYAWIVWTVFTFLLMWIFPTFIAPMFNKFQPLKDKELKQEIKNLLSKAGFNSKGIFVIDGSKRSTKSNAYFTGFGTNKRIVFFDTLMKTLTNKEILAVLAHELGHFKHKHIVYRMAQSIAISFIAFYLLGFLESQTSFYLGLGFGEKNIAAALLLFVTVVPSAFFLISPIMAKLSRKDEFEADSFAAKHTASKDLISALLKLYRDNAATLTPDRLYSAYHDSHPPASIRIAHLRKK